MILSKGTILMNTLWKTTINFVAIALATAITSNGCSSPEKEDREFHTSGSREADQRAEQRIAKVQQLRGEGGDEADAKRMLPLFDRLGGEKGVAAIVDDFVSRALADPRVNWERKGIERGGVLGIGGKPVEWDASEANVAQLKKHLVQFIAVATGGRAHYDGRDMKVAHAGMKITNAEFDAALGDLKVSLDRLGVAIDEQKELLAIVESTRPQIVEER
jgi:hemoglobin